jgi:divalent metal cation (Fe/Co/Zn/Cd) transporter
MRQSASLVQTGCCERRPRRGRPRPDFASVATALAANTTIAAAKGTAAAVTGSPALVAETLHPLADAGNEVVLWVALRRSRRAPDASHPLGHGPERYYWALLAAVGMFVVGGSSSRRRSRPSGSVWRYS